MQLPAEFITKTRQLLGEERFQCYMRAFEEEAPVSIRVNAQKCGDNYEVAGERVPWCRNGYYLPTRPNFTFDPLLHAGCYYVQEASSMFLDEVLRQHMPQGSPLMALDLCAAPGGKSTLLRAALPVGSTLFSNEPNPKRASILAENMAKWSADGCIVTNNYPRDYRKAKLKFDLVLCDVPCSGEGMFRKDDATIGEWSPENVEKCWQLQREIVADAWQCLCDGGLMVYSTCTLNTQENEENIRWMMEELGAKPLPVATQADWHITGSLLPGFEAPVYRFIPGLTRGEGLFMCVMRKGSRLSPLPLPIREGSNIPLLVKELPNCLKRVSTPLPHREGQGGGSAVGGEAPLTYPQAISYLRRKALVLPPDTPRGIIDVSYRGHVLGQVKNIGSRANNLYPKEWRIKSTYVPAEPQEVLHSRAASES